MPLTGNWTLAILSALALGAVVGAALFWNRIGSWLRWPARAGLLVTCQLTACALVAAFVNDAGQFYGSWSELFGNGSNGVSVTHVAGGSADRNLAATLRREGRVGKSLIVPVYVPVAGSTRAQPALVYLPAAYFAPSYAQTQFPVVELLDGFPGTPESWTGAGGLRLQSTLDGEIASQRAIPFIAVMPTQNYLRGWRDGECINAVKGAQVETTLTVNVQRVIEHDFRADRARTGWAVMGYSTGGFCALNIAMRHPNEYAAAVSMSGTVRPYVDGTTGALFGKSAAAEQANDPLWRAQHLPAPPISILLAASRQDPNVWQGALEMAAAVRPPTRVSMLMLPRGSHNLGPWRAMEPVAFDWLSHVLPPPLGPMVLAQGHGPVPYNRMSVFPPPSRRIVRAATRPTFQ